MAEARTLADKHGYLPRHSRVEAQQLVLGLRRDKHRGLVETQMVPDVPTTRPFSHEEFRIYPFEGVPLDEDIFLMDEKWMPAYEAACLEMNDRKPYRAVGYVSYAAVNSYGAESLELSWYPNIADRFHEVFVRLPRRAFVTCVDMPRWGVKPRMFVKSDWLIGLHLRPYSAFALIDAVGVKASLQRGELTGPRLAALRTRIDKIAAMHLGVVFLSFADSLLLKINWFVGHCDSDIEYSYDPETLVQLLPAILTAIREELGLSAYAVVTQGVNEYEDVALLSRSASGNHISLNSLGLPFAQLLAIDSAVRDALRAKRHEPHELYLEDSFYRSLRLKFEKNRNPSRWQYDNPIDAATGTYVCCDCTTIMDSLEAPAKKRRKKRA